MDTSNQGIVQQLADKQAIHDLLMRYCRGIDRRDEELMRSAYHPDAIVDHGIFKGNAWEFAAFILPHLLETTESTQHTITNHLVELIGDTAYSEARFVTYRVVFVDDSRRLETYAGRYIDRLERRGGEWRIVERRVVDDWAKSEALDYIPTIDVSRRARGNRKEV